MAKDKNFVNLNLEMYPLIEPYRTGRLKVSDLHELYFEECGNPNGNPVVFLHGGPGSGIMPGDRRFFDPQAYRIILFDQRGAGKSPPSAEVKENTTWDLVADIEKLRVHMGVDGWVVIGGSWGSTLALVYAESHPDRVKALIVYGILLGTRDEDDWQHQFGASQVFPEQWEKFIEVIPRAERRSLLDAYHRRLMSDDPAVFVKYAREWNKWEMATVKLIPDEEAMKRADEDDQWSLQHARTECHYFINGVFLESENWILNNADKLHNIPGVIIQGRYDMPCPPAAAWNLHKSWPRAEFKIIPDAGHSSKEVGIAEALVQAADKYKTL